MTVYKAQGQEFTGCAYYHYQVPPGRNSDGSPNWNNLESAQMMYTALTRGIENNWLIVEARDGRKGRLQNTALANL
jgi:hypothetical protein